MAPITEQNNAQKPHPGAEAEARARVRREHQTDEADAIVLSAVRGKPLALRVAPTAITAIIVGVLSHFLTAKPDPVSDMVGQQVERCNTEVSALRADFNQFKAEKSLYDKQIEWKLNELLSRTAGPKQ